MLEWGFADFLLIDGSRNLKKTLLRMHCVGFLSTKSTLLSCQYPRKSTVKGYLAERALVYTRMIKLLVHCALRVRPSSLSFPCIAIIVAYTALSFALNLGISSTGWYLHWRRRLTSLFNLGISDRELSSVPVYSRQFGGPSTRKYFLYPPRPVRNCIRW